MRKIIITDAYLDESLTPYIPFTYARRDYLLGSYSRLTSAPSKREQGLLTITNKQFVLEATTLFKSIPPAIADDWDDMRQLLDTQTSCLTLIANAPRFILELKHDLLEALLGKFTEQEKRIIAENIITQAIVPHWKSVQQDFFIHLLKQLGDIDNRLALFKAITKAKPEFLAFLSDESLDKLFALFPTVSGEPLSLARHYVETYFIRNHRYASLFLNKKQPDQDIRYAVLLPQDRSGERDAGYVWQRLYTHDRASLLKFIREELNQKSEAFRKPYIQFISRLSLIDQSDIFYALCEVGNQFNSNYCLDLITQGGGPETFIYQHRYYLKSALFLKNISLTQLSHLLKSRSSPTSLILTIANYILDKTDRPHFILRAIACAVSNGQYSDAEELHEVLSETPVGWLVEGKTTLLAELNQGITEVTWKDTFWNGTTVTEEQQAVEILLSHDISLRAIQINEEELVTILDHPNLNQRCYMNLVLHPDLYRTVQAKYTANHQKLNQHTSFNAAQAWINRTLIFEAAEKLVFHQGAKTVQKGQVYAAIRIYLEQREYRNDDEAQINKIYSDIPELLSKKRSIDNNVVVGQFDLKFGQQTDQSEGLLLNRGKVQEKQEQEQEQELDDLGKSYKISPEQAKQLETLLKEKLELQQQLARLHEENTNLRHTLIVSQQLQQSLSTSLLPPPPTLSPPPPPPPPALLTVKRPAGGMAAVFAEISKGAKLNKVTVDGSVTNEEFTVASKGGFDPNDVLKVKLRPTDKSVVSDSKKIIKSTGGFDPSQIFSLKLKTRDTSTSTTSSSAPASPPWGLGSLKKPSSSVSQAPASTATTPLWSMSGLKKSSSSVSQTSTSTTTSTTTTPPPVGPSILKPRSERKLQQSQSPDLLFNNNNNNNTSEKSGSKSDSVSKLQKN